MERLPLPTTDKSLGQHFLKDQLLIEKICVDFKDSAEAILEIGPGPGILTETLAKIDLPFHVIEKDSRFKEYLDQFIKNNQITMGDALQIDMETFVQEKFGNKKLWLVSNLPYNIASPLLINFLKAPSIQLMTLMFQQEVADKVVPFVSKKNTMNSLMVLCQSYFECSLLQRVPPGSFTPPPRVESAVLSMKRRAIPLVPLEEFKTLEKFIRIVFSQKRKQLGGILKSHFEPTRIQEIFRELNIELTIRAEALTLENILDLYRMFK